MFEAIDAGVKKAKPPAIRWRHNRSGTYTARLGDLSLRVGFHLFTERRLWHLCRGTKILAAGSQANTGSDSEQVKRCKAEAVRAALRRWKP